MCTWPPTISLRAPVLLLYATWRMSVPVIKRSNWVAKEEKRHEQLMKTAGFLAK
jgi:hypothetical protein